MLDATDGVGGRIRAARRTADLTQRELADRLDVSLGTIERFETGRRDPAAYLEDIAAATSADERWLREGDLGDGGAQLDALRAQLADRERTLAWSEARLCEAAEAIEAGWLRLREAEKKWASHAKEALAAVEERESAAAERDAELDDREAAICGREDALPHIGERGRGVAAQADELSRRAAELDERDAALAVHERDKRQALDRQIADVAAREQHVADTEQALARQADELKARASEASFRVEALRARASELDQ
jgi:transcriptional regulator with XRE-family HTH domain